MKMYLKKSQNKTFLRLPYFHILYCKLSSDYLHFHMVNESTYSHFDTLTLKFFEMLPFCILLFDFTCEYVCIVWAYIRLNCSNAFSA